MTRSMDYLVIGLGGFLGANARYLVSLWVGRMLGLSFPYGTLIINVSGSFALGLLMGLCQHRLAEFFHHRLFFAVGFLGAYTTFSTFTYETFRLVQEELLTLALVYIFGSLLLGMIGVICGFALGSLFAR
jgi:fluoride exporter